MKNMEAYVMSWLSRATFAWGEGARGVSVRAPVRGSTSVLGLAMEFSDSSVEFPDEEMDVDSEISRGTSCEKQ